jgi:hypothetical protein
MAGLILGNQGNAAMRAFIHYRREIPLEKSWQPVFRFLVGQIDAAPARGIPSPPN